MGTQGALQIDEREHCKLRYFDAKKTVRPTVTEDTPIGRAGSHFSGSEEIPWVEEEFDVAPKQPMNFWMELYKTYRKGTVFPVTLEQARENMRVISLAKKGTDF